MGYPKFQTDMARYGPISSSRITVLLLVVIGFWFGAMFSHQLLGQMNQSKDTTCPCNGEGSEIFKELKPDFESKKAEQQEVDPAQGETGAVKKVIYLYDSPEWRDADLWKASDWQQKCHRTDCSMTKNQQLLQKSSAVLVNSLSVSSDVALRHLKDRMDRNSFDKIRFAFFSGVTPLETTFDATKYDDIFDMTITYKANSDIQLSYWPSTGILPAQLRSRNPSRTRKYGAKVHKMDPKPGKFDKNFFHRNGKEQFMAYIVRTCDDSFYGNRFVMKLREEGLINIYTTKHNCTKILPEPEILPCDDIYSDHCVKFMEKFKFVVITEANSCEDFIPKDYWYALTAWEAVPVLFSGGNCTKMGIPGSCIDALESEYVSPTFKKAYAGNLDIALYKNFWDWKQTDVLEEYHWQCELCEQLHQSSDDGEYKEKFSSFWDTEKNCGKSMKRNELMRSQLVRVGAIPG